MATILRIIIPFFVGFFSFLGIVEGSQMINGLLDDVEVLEISASKQSIVLGRGSLEGVKLGQRGQFYFQEGQAFPDIKFVADGECVKAYRRKSFWLLSNFNKSFLLSKGAKISLVGQGDELAGRAPWKVLKKTVVLKKGQKAQDYIKDGKVNTGIPVYKEEDQEFEERVLGTGLNGPQLPNKDRLDDLDFASWESEGDLVDFDPEYDDKLKSLEISFDGDKVGGAERIKAELNRQASHSTLKGAIDKATSALDGLPGLYYEQRRMKELPFMQEESVHQNVYNKTQYKENHSRFSPEVLAKLHKEKGRWSRDMPDHEIARFFDDSGLLEESKRQQYALHNSPGHEVFFHMGMGLNTHTFDDDDNNQGTGSDMTFGYEYQLMRFSRRMKSWTVDFSYSLQTDFYSINDESALEDEGTINVESAESIFRLYINWYFYRYPMALNQLMAHIGIGVGIGQTIVSSPLLTEDYTYAIRVPLTYQIGLKYRFKVGTLDRSFSRIGIGLHTLLTMDTKNLTTSDELVDNIDGTKQVNDIKLSFGASIYF